MKSIGAKSVDAHQFSKRDCHSVIEISESSANTPPKSQRKNKPAASNIEIASGRATSSYAQGKSAVYLLCLLLFSCYT